MCDASVIDHTVVSLDRIGVLPWCFILWCIWFILYTVYKKASKLLLRRISMNEVYCNEMIRVYWEVCFTGVTIPFALANLSVSLEEVLRMDVYALFEESAPKWWSNNSHSTTASPLHAKLSFILLTGFYLNHVSQISIRKGFTHHEFLAAEFFLIFFISTFTLRCLLFGIAVVSVTNIVQFALEVSRLLTIFADMAKSKFIRMVANVFLAVYSFVWCVAFLHILPKYFLCIACSYDSLSKLTDLTQVTCLITLNLALWAYYILELYHSPVTIYVWNTVTGKQSTVESLLFRSLKEKNEDPAQMEPSPTQDETNLSDLAEETEENPQVLTFNINPCCNNKCNQQNFTPAQDNINQTDFSTTEGKRVTRKNLKVVYQTIKCYMVLKRKIESMRARKKDKESIILETSSSPPQHTDNNAIVESEDDDLTTNEDEGSLSNCASAQLYTDSENELFC